MSFLDQQSEVDYLVVLLLPFGPVVLGCEEFWVSSLEQISWLCFRSHSVISQLDCFRFMIFLLSSNWRKS
jgi:hypothetical protein